jgi:hypothetical protein
LTRDVFISYSSRDRAIADAVCHRLEADGARCWIAPRDIPPGDSYARRIKDAIRQSRVLVVVLSAGANASPHVMREVERAVHYGVAILPLRIEDVLPSDDLEYFLATVHWIDALTPPRERQIEALSRRVRRLLHPDAPDAGEDEDEPPAPAGRPPAPAPPGREVAALGRWLARDRALLAALVALALVPVVADFVLHLHLAPPWPDRLAVSLFTGVVNALALSYAYVMGRGATFERLRAWLIRAGVAAGACGLVFLVLRASVVWNAPTPHDQEVGGFLLRPSIRMLLETDEETIQDLLIGYENDPTNVWELWTVAVDRVALLLSWLGACGALSVAVAILVVLAGSGARWPEPAAESRGAGAPFSPRVGDAPDV